MRQLSNSRLRAALTALICAVVALGCGEDRVERNARPTASGFVDSSGRTVILRGPNVRVTGLFDGRPHDDPAPFDAAECERLASDFGMNVVRMTLSWSLIEPERGHYDAAYLDRLQDLVESCDRVGVSTLLDLHQDGYSKYIGLDGAPHWAHLEPLPPSDLSAGGSADPTQPAVTAAFNDLFADGSATGVAFTELLTMLARRFGTHRAVIGIEILNEPYALFDPERLFAFYTRVVAAMRRARSDVPIFLEPSADRNIFDRAALPVSLDFDPSNVVYAPHLYTGVFADPWQLGDRARIEASVGLMVDEAHTLGVPLFVGEWGGPNDPATGRPWSEIAVELFDQHLLSWTNWVYDERSAKCANIGPGYCVSYFELAEDPASPGTYVRTGPYRADAIALYARSFPHAISGRLDAFTYSPTDHALTVTGRLDGTHDLGAPALTYPAGVEVRCDDELVANTSPFPGVVRMKCRGAQLRLTPL